MGSGMVSGKYLLIDKGCDNDGRKIYIDAL